MIRVLLTTACFLFSYLLLAQQAVDPALYRTIDGRGNNQTPRREHWGAAHTALFRLAGNGFADGIGEPAGPDRPNPRVISNALFAQEGLLNDPVGLSDFTWVFGQFIDHDLGLTEGAGEPLMIPVPAGDVHFDPFRTGRVVIPMTRNQPILGTGFLTGNPRQYNNELTAFLDGSAVYGSDEARAEWLRSHVDGKLKVSAGNQLPYNTVTGERGDATDPVAPHMGNDVGFRGDLFVAGDVRANENPLLAAFHTLFVREHNRRCDLLKAEHPEWDDEQLYQMARKYVGGVLQAIVYNEWLPVMGVELPPYRGYDPGVRPQLTNVFTAAAFRVGHTLLNSNIRRVDANGNVLPEGNLTLREAFFNPDAIPAVGGIEPYLRGMAEQTQQQMDNRVVDDVRNFLFGPPGAGGLDLASINIMRGRERGLTTYNEIRQSYGMNLIATFPGINPDPEVYRILEDVYNHDLEAIDPWVAMLAERSMDGSIFGPTIRTIMTQQFAALRDGDRFFYLNDPVLTDEQKAEIDGTTFHDVIMANTTIDLMQDNVFRAMPFSDICGNMTTAADGIVYNQGTDQVLNDVTIVASDGRGQIVAEATTTEHGFFAFDALPACTTTSIEARRPSATWREEVDIFDMVTLQRHLLGIELIDDPYRLLAADVTQDDQVDVRDIITIMRLNLGILPNFESPTRAPWVFVPAGYEFRDPANPTAGELPLRINFDEVEPGAGVNQGFIGFKLGDVNASAR